MKKIFITILVLSLCIAGYFEGESSYAAPRIGNPVIDNDIITLGFKNMNMGSLTPEDVLISEQGANKANTAKSCYSQSNEKEDSKSDYGNY